MPDSTSYMNLSVWLPWCPHNSLSTSDQAKELLGLKNDKQETWTVLVLVGVWKVSLHMIAMIERRIGSKGSIDYALNLPPTTQDHSSTSFQICQVNVLDYIERLMAGLSILATDTYSTQTKIYLDSKSDDH